MLDVFFFILVLQEGNVVVENTLNCKLYDLY